MNATMASDVANANPGSQVLVHWVGGATGSSNVGRPTFTKALLMPSHIVASQRRTHHALHD